MILSLWILAGACAALVMMHASRAAVHHAVALASRLKLPPFIVGVTLVALGTDTPELVNSVMSSWLGHGDVNVGDSVGSVFTQATLILGLFPLMASGVLRVVSRDIWILSALIVAALSLGPFLMSDGGIQRGDAVLWIVFWSTATAVAWRFCCAPHDVKPPKAGERGAAVHAGLAILALAVTGAGATLLVKSIVVIASQAGVPEYLLSFFGASLGTSLPELVVEFTALRKGEKAIAMGDIFGACLIDSSLSIGIGPLLFPVAVSAPLALRGSLLAIAAIIAAALLLATRRVHDKWSGAILIGLYLAGYFAWFSA